MVSAEYGNVGYYHIVVAPYKGSHTRTVCGPTEGKGKFLSTLNVNMVRETIHGNLSVFVGVCVGEKGREARKNTRDEGKKSPLCQEGP